MSEEIGQSRRQSVRLMTVYAGRLVQAGRAYPCTISDVSESGAKIKLKDMEQKSKFLADQPVRLIFDRLGEYKALSADIAWNQGSGAVAGLRFTESPEACHKVLERLMPNRWNMVKGRNDGAL